MGHGASSQGRATPTVVAAAAPAAAPGTAAKSARTAKSEASIERSKTAALLKPSPAAAGPLDGARFVTLDALRAHGKLPRCGSRPKYRHPLTEEGNANLCRRRSEFDAASTLFVYVSHQWARPEEDPEIVAKAMLMELPGKVRAAAASKHREQWGGMSWEGKLQAASAIPSHELDPAISHKVTDARRQ